MKLKPVFTIIFLAFFSFSFSQSIDFEGVITDAFGNTILGANIIAVEKNTQVLDGFGISNDSGYFRLTLKKDMDYDIKISFIGFQQIAFVLNKTADFKKDFKLEQQSEALDEVELVYEMPVTIKGDTIIYNADSFNTGTERKLGDVLKNISKLNDFKNDYLYPTYSGLYYAGVQDLNTKLIQYSFDNYCIDNYKEYYKLHEIAATYNDIQNVCKVLIEKYDQ